MKFIATLCMLLFAVAAQAKAPEIPALFVIGDSLARGLAPHLSVGGMEPVACARDGHGLVAPQGWVADWRMAVKKRNGPFALISLGANDLSPIGTHRPLSEAWKRAYADRMAALFKEIRAAGVRPVWLEIPPMRDEPYAKMIDELARFQLVVCQEHHVPFILIRTDLKDRHKEYAAFSPENVRWRTPDGVHFTDAGYAFWAERIRERFPYR